MTPRLAALGTASPLLVAPLLAPPLLAALLLAAQPASAQTQSAKTPQPPQTAAPATLDDLLRARGEAYSRSPDSEQDPEEQRVTRALNAEIAAQNDLAESQENADFAAWREAVARRDREIAARELEAAEARHRHNEQLRESDAALRRYEAALADWRATVAACERGDRARCTAGQTPAAPR